MLINPESYPFIYFTLLLLIIALYTAAIVPIKEDRIQQFSQEGFSWWGVILAVFVILFLGLRPIHECFVDTVGYARSYQNIELRNATYFDVGDRGFKLMMHILHSLGFSVHSFFCFIEFVYVGCLAYVCHKLFRRNAGIALVAIFSMFFFYDLAVNVLRNGISLSLTVLSVYLFENKNRISGSIVALCALSIHISVLLVFGAYFCGKLFCRPKLYLWIWLGCLILSVFVGKYFETIFSNLGFLSSWRNTNYLVGVGRDMSLFSRTGYRLDFLLFSIPPIIWIWYRIFKQKTTDEYFYAIANIYLIVNAVWLLVNQSWLSNRIAYLSWFFYSLVFMYPLLKEENVPHRKLTIALYLFGCISFSYLYKVI